MRNPAAILALQGGILLVWAAIALFAYAAFAPDSARAICAHHDALAWMAGDSKFVAVTGEACNQGQP